MDIQGLFITLLMIVLAIATVSFLVAGWRQHRRRVTLARWAANLSMRFSPDDLFDIPSRYAPFALISGGHSPAAYNLTYGRLEGWPIRAFDFRYEVGHGTRRTTRRYEVLLLELPKEPPGLLMWRQTDFAPLAAADAAGRVQQWTFAGDVALANRLADVCHGLCEEGACIQVHQRTLMIALPQLGRSQSYHRRVGEALRTAQALAG